MLMFNEMLEQPRVLANSIQRCDSDIAYSTQVGRLKEGKSWNCQARSVAIFKSLSSLHIQSKVIDILKGLAQDSSRQIGNDSPTLF